MAQTKEYRELNKEKLAAQQRRWYQNLTPEQKAARYERLKITRKNYSLEKIIKSQRKRLYKLSEEEAHKLFDTQQGKCAICAKPLEFYSKYTHLDHDHSCCPGQKSCGQCVRGFLCSYCNKGLGFFKESPSSLSSAIRYLEA